LTVEYEGDLPQDVIDVMEQIGTAQIGWMSALNDRAIAAPMLLIYVLTMYMRVCDEHEVDEVIHGARMAAQDLIDREDIEITPIEIH
jgi:hypothetical protein